MFGKQMSGTIKRPQSCLLYSGGIAAKLNGERLGLAAFEVEIVNGHSVTNEKAAQGCMRQKNHCA